MTINEDTVKLMATYLSKGIPCATIKNNKADLFVLSQVGGQAKNANIIKVQGLISPVFLKIYTFLCESKCQRKCPLLSKILLQVFIFHLLNFYSERKIRVF